MTNTPTTTRTPGSPPSSGSGTEEAGAARHVAETGREKANEVAGEVRTQTADLAHSARDQAKQRADGEVGRLAGFLGEIGEELEGMAARSGNDGHLPGLARDGAQAANRLSHRLESGGLDGALHDVKDFARRRPGTFLAAAFGVGLALGRVTRNVDTRAIADEMNRNDDLEPRPAGAEQPSPAMTPSPTMAATTAPTSDAGQPAAGRLR